jgi:hypothetical protein
VSALGGIGGVTKGARVTQICRRLGAGTYLSGQGARKYQDQADFDEHGIERYGGFRCRYMRRHGRNYIAGRGCPRR